MKNLYLKTKISNNGDEYYLRVDDKDKTWGSVLDAVEDLLDSKFVENGDKLEGIALDFELVYIDDDDIHWDFGISY